MAFSTSSRIHISPGYIYISDSPSKYVTIVLFLSLLISFYFQNIFMIIIFAILAAGIARRHVISIDFGTNRILKENKIGIFTFQKKYIVFTSLSLELSVELSSENVEKYSVCAKVDNRIFLELWHTYDRPKFEAFIHQMIDSNPDLYINYNNYNPV